MSLMRRATGYLLALLLVFAGQAHAQLGLTHAGKALAASGGGGGGDTVAVNNSISEWFDGTANGTTSSVTPGGSNRALFMGVGTANFGSTSTIDDARYGGSGGTQLTKIGTDETLAPGENSFAIYGIAASPNSSTTLFGDWSGTPVRPFVAGAFLENVNQTTPFEGRTLNSGGSGDPITSSDASVTITGMVSGQKAIAAVLCAAGGGDIGAFVAGSGTTIVTQTRDLIGGLAIIYGTASGTSLTLTATCSQTTANYLTWKVLGVRINPA